MSTVVGQDGFPVAEGGVVPQNRKPTGRRSDRTKAAILAAAREQFAAYGYERATIRAIAADAGRDPGGPSRHPDARNGAVPLRAPPAAGGGARSRRGHPVARPHDSAIPDGKS